MTLDNDWADLHTRLGLTRQELAAAMGVHYRTLQKWQLGTQHPPAVAQTMARLLAWLQNRGQLHDWLVTTTTHQPGNHP